MAKKKTTKKKKAVKKKAKRGNPPKRKSALDRKLEKVGYAPKRKNRFAVDDLEELPDIGVEYDFIHLSGDSSAVSQFEEENCDSCFGVDWRGEPDEVFDEINARIDDDVTWTDPKKGYVATLECGAAVASMRQSLVDKLGPNVALIKTINDLLKGEYEIRIFRHCMLDDSWTFLIKTADWWKAMDKHFGHSVDDFAVRIKEWNDFVSTL